MSELLSVFSHSIMITIFVFTMMLIVDYFNVLTKAKMEKAAKGGRFIYIVFYYIRYAATYKISNSLVSVGCHCNEIPICFIYFFNDFFSRFAFKG